MTYYKLFILGTLLCMASCERNEVAVETATLTGTIEVLYGGIPSAVKVVLSDVDGNSEDVAFSGNDGSFVFENIKPGYYYITFYKDGYDWIWTDLGVNDVITSETPDKRIKLEPGETKDLKVLMRGKSEEALVILDTDGNPVDRIHFDRGTASISFQLYNGYGEEMYWSINADNCYYADNMNFIFWFKSISKEDGVLLPGESAAVVCIIDKRIYEYRPSGSSHLIIYGGMLSRMELPLSYD